MKKIVLILMSFSLTAASFSQNNPIFQYKKSDIAPIKNSHSIPHDWEERKDSLNALKKRLNNLDLDSIANIDSLKMRIKEIKDYNTRECLTTQKKPRTFFLFEAGRYDFDTLNDFFYAQNNVDVFQTAAIQNFTNSSTVLSAELASFLFGPVRMGVGGTFETKQDTSEDNAIKKSLQKILYSGGDINLNFSVPVVFIHTRGRQVYFSIFAQTYNSINPGIDSTGATDFSKDVLYTNQSGLDFHFELGSNDHLGTANNNARLYFDFPIYYTWGTNATYEQLKQPDFSVIKMQFGAVLGNVVNIHVSGPLFSTSKNIQKIPFSVSLQFSPTKAVQSVSSKK
jgi:hypothetical protein